MDSVSPFERAKELSSQLGSILSGIDVDDLPAVERAAVTTVKQLAVDVRLEARDYEYAGTRAEQQQSAEAAKKYLERLRRDILKASEYGAFGAAEVAILSTKIEQIISGLQ